MPPESTSRSTRAGLSLYANLLDPSPPSTSGSSTISRAPVVFKHPLGAESQQEETAAQKQHLSTAKSGPPASYASPQATPQETQSSAARPALKNTLADWAATGDDDDVNGFYGGGEKRQRGGRKKRKKNKEESHVVQNWDDIYDPSRPNNYEEYKHSDEKLREVREWKDKLYAPRMARISSSRADSEGPDRRRSRLNSWVMKQSEKSQLTSLQINSLPLAYGPTAEDVYAQRFHLSQQQEPQKTYPQAVSHQLVTSPPPHTLPFSPQSTQTHSQLPRISAQPPVPTISRAPVRYNLPDAPAELPNSEAELEMALQEEDRDEVEPGSGDVQRSLRPGQRGFAERLMSKYGWTKGSGLGASGSGIVNPLRVQVEKQKKKPDSEGGGFVGPGARGKILGGKKKGGTAEADGGKFGIMSEVVILDGMVNGMDLNAEMEGTGDGGLMQEIGEECGEKYGRVERVFIDRSKPTNAPVFVRFTSQLSALRAVNALEGRNFNGNTIKARFYDSEKFEKGLYA
ncbi:MAG: hypothetical protein LQ347_002065 [Umbilicaria vellea]|nr:MAG: hypothetical protein LQ347_002065 [Umbilicaria vellea]